MESLNKWYEFPLIVPCVGLREYAPNPSLRKSSCVALWFLFCLHWSRDDLPARLSCLSYPTQRVKWVVVGCHHGYPKKPHRHKNKHAPNSPN